MDQLKQLTKMNIKEKMMLFLINSILGGVIINLLYLSISSYDYSKIVWDLNLSIILINGFAVFVLIPTIDFMIRVFSKLFDI